MASSCVYGPYKARKGYRMVVVEGRARKSIIVDSVEAGARLRADLEQALRQRGGRRVGDVLLDYQDYLQRVRGAVTSAHIVRAIARFLGEDTAIGGITPARASALYEAETRRVIVSRGKGQQVAAASHRTLLGQCKRFYAWACEHGEAPSNPFAGVRPVGKPKVGKAQLRIDEARRFAGLALARARQGDRAATAAVMALLMGMRAGEVLGRVVRDLDDDGKVLWITRGKTDNARRRLHVPEVLRPLLAALAHGRAPDALLFGHRPQAPQRPLSDAWLWGRVQQLCDQAGVPRVSTHSLRGLHSTLALEAGATSGAVAAALGHGSFQITAKHYAAPGTLERVRSRLVEAALGAAGCEPAPGPDPEAVPNPIPGPIPAPVPQPGPLDEVLATADPEDLRRALLRLSPALRDEVRRALGEPTGK